MDVTYTWTKADFGHQMQALVDIHRPDAECIRWVVDHLNLHHPATLYETFPPEAANHVLKKLEFHYTPKHASWLNQVEIEFSVLSHQCLDRRSPTQPELTDKLTHGSNSVMSKKHPSTGVLPRRMHESNSGDYTLL